MRRKACLALVICLALGAAGCGDNGLAVFGTEENGETLEETENTDSGETTDTGHAVESTVTLTEGKYSEEKLDASWDESSAVKVLLDGDSISSENTGVQIEGSSATITKAGTYILSGELKDGQIVINAEKQETVRLVLNGVKINSSTSAPVSAESGNVVILLADGTENTVSDSSQSASEGESSREAKAAVYAKDDLTFNGTGTLTVNGTYDHGIQSKNDLKFIDGTYNITSVGDGIVGKDSVSVKKGTFTIEAGGDGIKSTNAEETDKGYVMIEGGEFHITAENDGIQAETLLRVNDGSFDILTGQGSENAVQKTDGMPGGDMGRMRAGDMKSDRQNENRKPDEQNRENGDRESDEQGGDNGNMKPENQGEDFRKEDNGRDMGITEEKKVIQEAEGSSEETPSTKALKSYVELVIAGGEFVIDACDDALHSNQNLMVEAGTFSVNTGDDGMHADSTLTINGGTIDIQKSYEGLEGYDIIVNDGDIKVAASDDGMNAAGDNDSAANPEEAEEASENPEFQEGSDGWGNGGFGNGGMVWEDTGASLTIKGGNIYVNAEGDGLDANGDIYIHGGTIVLHGPVNGGNGTFDYASGCQITGGTLLAFGSVGMEQNPGEDSTQPVIAWSMAQAEEAGTKLEVKNGAGEILVEGEAEKNFQWFAVSAPELKQGETYTVSLDDEETEVTLDSVLTQIQ